MDQMPFGADVSLAANPEPRVASMLVLDVSASMEGPAISQLNEGLATYKDELAADPLASKRVEVAVLTFGGTVTVQTDFAIAEHFTPPILQANGMTPMGAAINQAIDMVETRKQVYKANGVDYYRPWIFLITDGAPTDKWESAAERVRNGEASKAFSFFAVGVEGANFDILGQISKREPLKLKGLRFRDLFKWLSNSQQSVSRSKTTDAVPLENPTTPDGWAAV